MWYLANPKALFFAAFPLGLALYFIVKRRSRTSRLLLNLSGPLALLRQQSARAKRVFRLLFIATLGALLLLVWVIARPTRVRSWAKKWSEGIDIVIALDVSESMDADDIPPSRILVAKQVIRDFIRRRGEDRIGLVLFGGEAVTKCPLTRDFDFLLSQVEDVKLRELKQGTAIGMGLASSISRLRHSEAKNRIIILLTDGDSNVGAINPVTAAMLARQEGIKIYTIGIGKADRVVVPIYAYDMFGKRTQLIAQVPSYINPELLKTISRLTGGKSFMARNPGMLNQFVMEIDKLEKTKVKMIPMEEKDETYFKPALVATLLLGLIYCLQETRFRKARLRHAPAV